MGKWNNGVYVTGRVVCNTYCICVGNINQRTVVSEVMMCVRCANSQQ